MTRKSPRFASTGIRNWRELYTAALFETDKQELPSRIADAERALVLRARELFATCGDNGQEGQAIRSEEGQAIDDALYALRALRNCLGLNTNGPNAA